MGRRQTPLRTLALHRVGRGLHGPPPPTGSVRCILCAAGAAQRRLASRQNGCRARGDGGSRRLCQAGSYGRCRTHVCVALVHFRGLNRACRGDVRSCSSAAAGTVWGQVALAKQCHWAEEAGESCPP